MRPIKDTLRTRIPLPSPLGCFADWVVRAGVKTAKWSLKAIAVLIVLLLVSAAVVSVIGGRQYEAELQKLKASGEPYTLAQLAGPDIPDSENGAVVYREVFKALGLNSTRREPRATLPKAMDYIVSPEKGHPTPEDWAKARQLAAQYDGILPLVEKAAAMPACKFPTRWQDGMSALFPQLADLRDLAKLLAVKAVIYAREGNPDAAIRCFKLCLRTADAVKNEPVMISLLVRIGIANTAVKALQGVAQQSQLTPLQAKAAYDALSALNVRPQMALAMKGERGFGLWAIAYVRKHGVGCLWEGMIPEERPSFVTRFYRPLLYMDGAHYLRSMQKQVDQAALPYREIKPRMLEDDMPPTGVARLFMLANVLKPSLYRVHASVDANVAYRSAARAAMTLIAYKDRYGAYPATLDEASAKVGWEIPKDPFTNKSLVYKRRGAGFIVYSVGVNMKDDGGVKTNKGSISTEDGDIPWSLDR